MESRTTIKGGQRRRIKPRVGCGVPCTDHLGNRHAGASTKLQPNQSRPSGLLKSVRVVERWPECANQPWAVAHNERERNERQSKERKRGRQEERERCEGAKEGSQEPSPALMALMHRERGGESEGDERGRRSPLSLHLIDQPSQSLYYYFFFGMILPSYPSFTPRKTQNTPI